MLYVGKNSLIEVEDFRDQGFVFSEVESLGVHSLWLLKKALPSREEPDISLSIMNSKVAFTLTLYEHAVLLARSAVAHPIHVALIRRYIERVVSRKRKIAVRGDGGVAGVAGERNVVGVPKSHSWDKCTMPLANGSH